MITHKYFRPLILLILLTFILLLILLGQARGEENHAELREIKAMDQPVSPNGGLEGEGWESCLEQTVLDLDYIQKDLALNLLGKSFAEIKSLLGEPEELGYSSWYGPHHYMIYNLGKGPIRFCSPLDLGEKLAVSVFVGPGQEIMGATVGMTFAEIQDILGTPVFGPELGMGDLYYMDYFFSETTDQMQVLIYFSADAMNGPTRDAFIKWEAFEYDKVKII